MSAHSTDLNTQLLALLALSSKARAATSLAELRFLLLNETKTLLNYRQALSWETSSKTLLQSGLVQVDQNAAYVQWAQRVFKYLEQSHPKAALLERKDLPEALQPDWAQWWPQFALWMPGTSQQARTPGTSSIWLRDAIWQEPERQLLGEWLGIWHHANLALVGSKRSNWWRRNESSAGRLFKRRGTAPLIAFICLIGLAAMPVHLTVLAPAELVPTQAILLRAPLDGVVDQLLVQTNQTVHANEPLFSYDQKPLENDLRAAQEALAAAQAAYRQTAQRALMDIQAREQLSQIQGRIGELQSQVDYVRAKFDQSQVVAPADGTILLEDTSNWAGRTLRLGEPLLRIARPGEIEIEAWLAVGDAIELHPNAPVKLYLNARPLTPLSGELRFIAFEAQARPDGQYAYRVRARLSSPTQEMIGLKGTLKIQGDRVSALYWVFRRPLASLRAMIGW